MTYIPDIVNELRKMGIEPKANFSGYYCHPNNGPCETPDIALIYNTQMYFHSSDTNVKVR